jgi:general secretion pathway protein G
MKRPVLCTTGLPQRRRRGFTLMEILLVLAILGVIIGLVLPNLLGRQREANIGATKLAINNVEQALKFYAVHHNGEFPPSSIGLEALIAPPGSDPNWKGPYIESQSLPTDAWGSPLQYQYPGQQQASGKPDIWSIGPDMTPNTEDDITNWQTTTQ